MDSAVFLGHRLDTEFGLYHIGHDNASPEMQTKFVSIDGRTGDLDLTEQDGIVSYRSIDREWRFEKVTPQTTEDDVDLLARALRRVFLRSGNFVFDSDPEYYYYGRVTAINVSCEDGGRLVAVFVVHADPYKYKVDETIVSATVSQEADIVLSNIDMPVCPKIDTSSAMTLEYTINNVQYSATVQAGTHYVDTLVLFSGDTSVHVEGNGSILFTYREGAL